MGLCPGSAVRGARRRGGRGAVHRRADPRRPLRHVPRAGQCGGARVSRPNLFIVGAPKAATTSLYDYLSGHPEVFMCPTKEPLYFCPDVRSGRNVNRLEHPRDEARYLEMYADAGNAKRLGEATTRYLVSRE